MSSVTFATPFRTAPPTLQYSAPVRVSFDDAGAALSEAEASEFAVRLIDARSEADFDHLLCAILTHAARRAGGSLPTAVGSAIGGLLKSVARQGLARRAPAQALGLELEGLDGDERGFEAALRFVRLAAEAARHAAEEPVIAPSRLAAQAALAAASDIYAPPLLSAFAPYDRRRPVTTRGTARSALQLPPIAVWAEPFQYDPEMEYFLGGLIHSVGRAVGDVARTVSKVAGKVGKIPILGDIARAGIDATRLALGPAAIAIDAGSRLARGQNLGAALKGAVGGQIDAIRNQLKLAEMVAPFIPGIGTGVAAALGAANALAAGRPITEAVLAAARSALPGGKLAQVAFDVAQNLAKGKNIGEAALAAARDQLPGGPAARAAFDGAVALTQGKRLQDAAFAAAGRILPPSPFAADALSFVRGVANGQNIQNAALSVVGQRVLRQVNANATFTSLKDVVGHTGALGDVHRLAGKIAPFVPGVGTGVAAAQRTANALAAGRPITGAVLAAARRALPGGAPAQAAFDVALNLTKGKTTGYAARAAARNRLPGGPAARAAFDAAIALGQGKRLQDAAFAAANLPKRAWPRGAWRGLPYIALQRR
jgi:hypothetical protein